MPIKINEHSNDIGDWCPWSGTAATEDDLHDEDFACPALCADSGVEE